MPGLEKSALEMINMAEEEKALTAGRLGVAADTLPDPPGEAGTWTLQQVCFHFAALERASRAAAAAEAPPVVDHPAFSTWVPGLALSRTGGRPRPAARIVAFPCAGSAEDMYSSEGSGPRRAPSPLLNWCRDKGVEILAVQPPGRGARGREAPIPRAAALAAAALPALAPRLAQPGVPWFLVGHSAGAWVGYEFARAAAAAGLPPPTRAFLSAILPPDTPPEARPWPRSAFLSTAELQAECWAWGMSEAALSPVVWPTFEALLRADFQLFDEYEWEGGGLLREEARLACPLTVFAGTEDARCPPRALAGWARFAGAEPDGSPGFDLETITGPHLWPLNRAAKREWLVEIGARVAVDLGLDPIHMMGEE